LDARPPERARGGADRVGFAPDVFAPDLLAEGLAAPARGVLDRAAPVFGGALRVLAAFGPVDFEPVDFDPVDFDPVDFASMALERFDVEPAGFGAPSSLRRGERSPRAGRVARSGGAMARRSP